MFLAPRVIILFSIDILLYLRLVFANRPTLLHFQGHGVKDLLSDLKRNL